MLYVEFVEQSSSRRNGDANQDEQRGIHFLISGLSKKFHVYLPADEMRPPAYISINSLYRYQREKNALRGVPPQYYYYYYFYR